MVSASELPQFGQVSVLVRIGDFSVMASHQGYEDVVDPGFVEHECPCERSESGAEREPTPQTSGRSAPNGSDPGPSYDQRGAREYVIACGSNLAEYGDPAAAKPQQQHRHWHDATGRDAERRER